MAWGKPSDTFISDLERKLESNDPTLTCLHILSFRKLGQPDFVRLAIAIGKNSTLVEFSASGHVLTPETLVAFSEALKTNTSLKSFCVGNQELGDRGLVSLEAGLATSQLAVLDLELKGIKLAGAECLSRVSHSHPHLKDLRLSRNELCDESLRVLAGGLQHSVLEILDLRENKFGEEGTSAIAMFLQSPNCRIRKLLLCGNALGPSGVANVAKAIHPSSSLEELFLEGSGCCNDGATALAMALECAPRLHTLVLNDCGISASGARALATGVAKSAVLGTLRLNNNADLGDDGCRFLLAGACPTLHTLDLGRCGLSSAVLAACITSGALTHVCLFGNQLAEGLEAVLADPVLTVAAMQSGLVDLDVGGNSLEQRHADAITAWIAQPTQLPALRTLCVGGNTVTQEAWLTTTEACQALRPAVKMLF